MEVFPKDLVMYIAGFLERGCDALALSLVCRRFDQILHESMQSFDFRSRFVTKRIHIHSNPDWLGYVNYSASLPLSGQVAYLASVTEVIPESRLDHGKESVYLLLTKGTFMQRISITECEASGKEWLEFVLKNGKKISESSYDSGKRSGKSREWIWISTDNGEEVDGNDRLLSLVDIWDCYHQMLTCQEEWHNNLKNGWTREYNDIGTLIVSCHYVNGQRDGIETVFAEQDIKRKMTSWSMGLPDGVDEVYDESGHVQERCYWQKGLLHGEESLWEKEFRWQTTWKRGDVAR